MKTFHVEIKSVCFFVRKVVMTSLCESAGRIKDLITRERSLSRSSVRSWHYSLLGMPLDDDFSVLLDDKIPH